MSFNATLYIDPDSTFRLGTSHFIHEGRSVPSLVVDDGLTIQAHTWETMQRLVDALTAVIDRCKQVEAERALQPFNHPVDAAVSA